MAVNLAYLAKCTSCTVPQVVREILFILAVAAAGTIPVLVIASPNKKRRQICFRLFGADMIARALKL
jgi:hypothetical protein